ncbi:hypothetical protein TNCV_2153791 [Trichonephila clavipes]|nr:hypothetical protein TNCV_2153791 [Trichonephila clavipes]
MNPASACNVTIVGIEFRDILEYRLLNCCVINRHTGLAPGIMVWTGIGFYCHNPLVRPFSIVVSDADCGDGGFGFESRRGVTEGYNFSAFLLLVCRHRNPSIKGDRKTS